MSAPPTDTNQTPLLEMRAISKTFPGVVALDSMDFVLLPGEVHALIGENGAGKSTMIKIISGLYQPDSGEMLIDGDPVSFRGPADSIARRIKVVYQELDLVPGLSVGENVYLGAYPKKGGRVDWETLYGNTRELLDGLGLSIDPRTPVGELRVAEQQLVEIARALSQDARIVVMDEPTSALSTEEVDRLFRLIERLQERGVGVLYVTHKLDEIYRIADRVTVVRDGKHVVTTEISKTRPHDLVTWMVGRELTALFPKSTVERGPVLLQATDVSGEGIEHFDLTVHSGEIVGLFGLLGAGINTVARILFGASERTGGAIVLDGSTIKPNSPADAMEKGMGLLTENRKDDGLVLPMSVRDNMTLASLRQFARLSWLDSRNESEAATGFVERLSIRTPSLRQRVQFLSGGNQQKVLMARWLMRDPKILILAEPTRGIDVGSKAEIYRLMDEMAQRGLGIVFMSTEIPEILGIADRILVMREGRVTAEFDRSEATQEKLVQAAAVDPETSEAA
ncbi:MAG: sugar ABC transporter ATP-binding protein [Thermomicrobiales bacterium]|nr:sugar ABC transporter ATP-binding protein [Thermomicrobiales bacterium]MCO5220943.1 sugar ABC transporter ATP-binding protein [Thermomicrobiales bacterium]